MTDASSNIAIVGVGVAGITAAHILQRKYKITLFDKNSYVGGHTNTILVKDPEAGDLPVDTGFIVLNDRTYPTFHRFLSQLGVPVRNSDMSFGLYCKKSGLQYAGTGLDGLFAQRGNAVSPKFYRLLWNIYRFSNKAANDLDTGAVKGKSLQQYVAENGFSRDFVEDYLIPMGAAIWSTPSANMMQFPAETFFRFFKNHGLLHLNEMPQWQTVVGGSFSYVNAFLRQFKGKVETSAAVSRIGRKEDAVDITLDDGTIHTFDKVVIATHADEALKQLERPSAEEQELLGAWQYNHNHTVLHSDASVMPPNRRAWAAWNYYRHDDQNQLAVTYHMNRLQGLQTSRDYFVTLNSPLPIEPAKIIKEIHYTHPMYTFDAIKTQNRLPELNGKQNTFFCGSYFGFGFHEDAVKSGVAVAKSLGMEL